MTSRPSDLHRQSAEAGYVLAQTALLLIPLLSFAAFATDIGSWYVQGQKLQKTADAAALAGVTQLPDMDAAVAEARAVAIRNGFEDQTRQHRLRHRAAPPA